MASYPAQLRPACSTSTPLGESDVNIYSYDPKDMILDINSMIPPPYTPEKKVHQATSGGDHPAQPHSVNDNDEYEDTKEDEEGSSPLSEIDHEQFPPPQIFSPGKNNKNINKSTTQPSSDDPLLLDDSETTTNQVRSGHHTQVSGAEKENQLSDTFVSSSCQQVPLPSNNNTSTVMQPSLIFPSILIPRHPLRHSLLSASTPNTSNNTSTFASSVRAGLNGKKIFVRERSRNSLGVVVKGEKANLDWPWDDDDEKEVREGKEQGEKDDPMLFSTYLTSAQNSQERIDDDALHEAVEEAPRTTEPSLDQSPQPVVQGDEPNISPDVQDIPLVEISQSIVNASANPQRSPLVTASRTADMPPPGGGMSVSNGPLPSANDSNKHHKSNEKTSKVSTSHVSLPPNKPIVHPNPAILPTNRPQASSSSVRLAPAPVPACVPSQIVHMPATTAAMTTTQPIMQQLPLPQQGYQFPIPPLATQQNDGEHQIVVIRRLLQAKEIINSLQDRIREVEMEKDWAWASLFWTNNVADRLVPQGSCLHISNIFAKLCGRYIQGPIETSGAIQQPSSSVYSLLIDLARAVGSPTPALQSLPTCPIMESIFYRSLRILMRGYDPLTPLKFDPTISATKDEDEEIIIPVNNPVEFFQPPDVLWIFSHIGEPTLYVPFLNAIRTSLWSCPDTRRGISLLLLLGRLQGGQMAMGFKDRLWARNLGLSLEMNGCRLGGTAAILNSEGMSLGRVDENEIRGAIRFVKSTRRDEAKKRMMQQGVEYQVEAYGGGKRKGKGKGRVTGPSREERGGDEDEYEEGDRSKSKGKRKRL
uniref:Uncharacterized protein n=1 Tax=Kwoniella bestiolae CBS 10118 TaxID=1296100 RepID=A0A1B9G2H2_9TREE|nr:hypothetical protein I302_05028 [Kwoniella bestiolae CBS 10118]OCF25215.1 hypothetical protein I302_05028 [Kwoniella bestiolae CBS 10118]